MRKLILRIKEYFSQYQLADWFLLCYGGFMLVIMFGSIIAVVLK